jgi:hypothetical protein
VRRAVDSVFCFGGLTRFSTSLTDIFIGGGFVVVSTLIVLATLLQSTSFALLALGSPLSSSLEERCSTKCVNMVFLREIKQLYLHHSLKTMDVAGRNARAGLILALKYKSINISLTYIYTERERGRQTE